MGENVKLRPLEISDAESIAKNANSDKIALYMRAFPYPYTIDDAYDFLNSYFGGMFPGLAVWAIMVDGEYAGSISLTLGSIDQENISSKRAEIGYWIGEEFWGRGIVTSAVKEICEYGFENYDIERIEADVFSPNKASMRVLEKAGFEHEAILKKTVFKNGELLDTYVFAKFRE